MSNSIGHFFSSLMAKILLGFLIVAFGAWGVGDMLRGNPSRSAVLKIGEVTVSTSEVRRAFVNEMRRLRQAFGPQLTAQDAAKFGVFDQILSQMATRGMLEAAASDMNVGVSDAAIQKLITTTPSFMDQGGKFNREYFRRVLETNGYSEKSFLAMAMDDMTRQRVLDSVRLPVVVPDIMVEPLLRHQGERREIETLKIAAAAQAVPADPGDETLSAFHKDHPRAWTAPEYRKITVLVLSEDAVRDQVKLTDADLKTYYDEHTGDFTEPEGRELSQILVKDEDAAKRVAAALREGRAPDAVAKAEKAAVTDLGWVTRDALFDSLSRPAFAAKKGEVLDPISTRMGWHVLVVKDIRPAKTAEFGAVRDKVKTAAAADKATGALYRLSATVEDALAAGTSLEDVAKAQKLKLTAIAAVDAKGLAPDGKPAATLPSPEILKAAFEQDGGNQSPLTEYEGNPGGYFLVRTDGVTPSALRPFAEVRGQVLDAWRADRRQAAAEAAAKALADDFAKAGDAAAFAKAHKAAAKTETVTRAGDADLPPALVAKLFEAKPGQAETAPAADGAIVARVAKVIPVNVEDYREVINRGKRQLRQAMGDALLAPFTTELGDKFAIKQFRSVDSLVKDLN